MGGWMGPEHSPISISYVLLGHNRDKCISQMFLLGLSRLKKDGAHKTPILKHKVSSEAWLSFPKEKADNKVAQYGPPTHERQTERHSHRPYPTEFKMILFSVDCREAKALRQLSPRRQGKGAVHRLGDYTEVAMLCRKRQESRRKYI